ncbi:MAG: amino acid permease, partial [Planctomycetota bacterium]|nr:amino acid permease [Planctomycetota bacterium]
VSPNGFHLTTLFPNGRIFPTDGVVKNTAVLMKTIALIYAAYVGFEVIADDAEEMQNPGRNIPLGILISLTLCMGVYVLVSMVTLGTIPWQQLAGSDTALSDAARRFLPGVGVPLLGLAGIVATLTTLNTTMLRGCESIQSNGP